MAPRSHLPNPHLAAEKSPFQPPQLPGDVRLTPSGRLEPPLLEFEAAFPKGLGRVALAG